MEIRESQIEDILVSAPVLTKTVLRLQDEPRLLSRQMLLPSGRLDLLYAHRTELLLIELKAVPFQKQHLRQVCAYLDDLHNMQKNGALVQGQISPYLLVTHATSTQSQTASASKIICLTYNPEEILTYFYKNLKPIALFTKTKPIDIGIWNIHLIHNLLYAIQDGIARVSDLRKQIGGSPRTLYNKIKFASELRLIEWSPNQDSISLSAFGNEYCALADAIFPSGLSDSQAALIRSFVMANPYESSVVLGIASAVEAVFALAKNTYPIPMDNMISYFTLHAGKFFDWKTDKAKYNATRMYTNYAADLGLIAKTDNNLYLTPEGIKFTVQMQLHKGLKLVDSMKVA
jgi:hypothetical protein